MRPVNLLPESARTRSGSGLPGAENKLGYGLIALLVVILLGVFAMVHFSNQVGEKQDEVAQLQATEAEARARAASLAQFTSFQNVREARLQTITALAQSRFDWERVMRELAIVLPKRVWLTNLTGTVSPDVTVENAASVTARVTVPGPALQLAGCARSQRDVARLIAALEDLDGVTRVTVEDSAKPDGEVSVSGSEGEANTSEDCRTREFITQFHAVAAFDAVTVPDGAEPTAPVTPPATTSTTTETTTTTASAETPDPAAGSQTTEQEGVEGAQEDSGKALELLGEGKQR